MKIFMQEKIFKDAQKYISENNLDGIKGLFQAEVLPEDTTANRILKELAEQKQWALIPGLCTLITQEKTREGIEVLLKKALVYEQWERIEFLCSLTSINKPSQALIDDTLMGLAKKGIQWDLIKTICKSDNKPSTTTMDFLLRCAYVRSQWEIITFFCSLPSINRPSQAVIDETLIDLAKDDKWELIKTICDMKDKPSKTTMGTLLRKAYIKSQWESVTFFCSLPSINRPSQKVIDETLIDLAKDDKWELIKTICDMEDKPSTETIEALLRQAYIKNQGESIKFFCSLSSINKPSQAVIDGALIYLAKDNKQWELIKTICDMENKPSTKTIEALLNEAYGWSQWSIIGFFCSLTSINKPSQEAIDKILIKLAGDKQWELIKTICKTDNKPRTKTMDELLREAYFQSQWESITFFCSLPSINKPSQVVIDKTLIDLAEKTEQWDLIKTICDMEDKPSTKTMEALLHQACVKSQWGSIKFFCSLPSINKLSQEALEETLIRLTEAEQWDLIKIIYQIKHINKPSQKTIEKLLVKATTSKQLEVIQVICNVSAQDYPDNKFVHFAFLEAAKTGFVESLQFFSEHEALNESKTDMFTKAFLEGIKYEQIETLKYIGSLIVYTDEEISLMLEEAVDQRKFKNLQFLLETYKPEPKRVKEMFLSLIKSGNNMPAISYFCDLKGIYELTSEDINNALKFAVTNNHLLLATRLLNASVQPDIAALLVIAVSKGFKEIVECFIDLKSPYFYLTKFEPDTFKTSLLAAITAPNGLEIIQQLIVVNKIKQIWSEESIKEALEEAQIQGKTEIYDFLKLHASKSNSEKPPSSNSETPKAEISQDGIPREVPQSEIPPDKDEIPPGVQTEIPSDNFSKTKHPPEDKISSPSQSSEKIDIPDLKIPEINTLKKLSQFAEEESTRLNHWYVWNGRKKASAIKTALSKLECSENKLDKAQLIEQAQKSGLINALSMHRHSFFSPVKTRSYDLLMEKLEAKPKSPK
jgi:hypothetical protein